MSLLVDIRKEFKGFRLDVSFETNGENLGLLGASGSGKSLTLKCIAGVETPDEGKIILNGRILFDSEKKVCLKPQERNVGFLFQNYALFPHMTVEENISLGLKLSKREKKEKVSELLDLFHLKGLGKKYPNQLSGGQQQRVALARCMAYSPEILLLDEPFSALDSHLKELVQNEVMELLKFYKGQVVMVTHSRDEAYRFCKNLVILDEGKSVLFGQTREVFNNPRLVTVARITGCKNISRCKIVSKNIVYAEDWGIYIETKKEIPQNTNYLGIKAHNFIITDDKKEKNTIECEIKRRTEELFEYTIMFKTKDSSFDNSTMVFKVKKDVWDKRKDKKRLFLRIPEEHLMFLE